MAAKPDVLRLFSDQQHAAVMGCAGHAAPPFASHEGLATLVRATAARGNLPERPVAPLGAAGRATGMVWSHDPVGMGIPDLQTCLPTHPVVINDDHVDVGDVEDTAWDPVVSQHAKCRGSEQPRFWFLLRNWEDFPICRDTIVVFDGQFTSQDRSRRTYTQQLICKKAGEAKQVIVTSHDPTLLKLIWDNFPALA